MVELLSNLLTDFILFSLVEGFIFAMYFHKVGGLRKMKIYEILIMSLGNCIISVILPEGFYQIVVVIFMTLLLKLYKIEEENFKKRIFCSTQGVLFFFALEIPYSILLDKIFSYGLIDIINGNKFNIFLLLIPIKILEIIIIYLISSIKNTEV